MNHEAMIAAARDCLKTPFMHQGRLPGTGLDCAGLLVVAARAGGVEVIDRDNYARTPHDGMLEAVLDAQPALEKVRGAPQVGDVILMRFGRDPQHLGLCTDNGLIHAYERIGQVVEHRIDEAWQRRIVAVYRFKGAA